MFFGGLGPPRAVVAARGRDSLAGGRQVSRNDRKHCRETGSRQRQDTLLRRFRSLTGRGDGALHLVPPIP